MSKNIKDYCLTVNNEECCFRIEEVAVPKCDLMLIRVFFRNEGYFIMAYSLYFLKTARSKKLFLLRSVADTDQILQRAPIKKYSARGLGFF